MSQPVDILHAAPVVHVPPRSRDPRTSYAPCVTRVVLPDLSRRDVSAGPDLPVNGSRIARTVLVGGVVFRPVGCDDVADKRKPGPSGEDFRAWLAGDPAVAGYDGTDVARALSGTPVLPRAPGARTTERPYGPWNQARAGRILHETREVAPGAVRRFVAESLALVDGRPFVRMPGPIAYHDDAMDVTQILRHPGAWTTNAPTTRGMPFRADRLDELARFEGKSSVKKLNAKFDPAVLSGVRLDRDDDVDLFLRDALRTFRGQVYDIVTGPGPFTLDRLDPLLRLAALGSASLIEHADRGPACELVVALAADYAERGHKVGWVPDLVRRIARYAETVAMPRILADTPAPRDDLDSLDALAP